MGRFAGGGGGVCKGKVCGGNGKSSFFTFFLMSDSAKAVLSRTLPTKTTTKT